MAQSPEEFVGAKVTLHLTSGLVLVGTVFSYCPKECTLVLLQNINDGRPDVKLVNTIFVKSIVVDEMKPKDPAFALPPAVAAEATLPTLVSSATEALDRKLNKTLNKAVERRKYPNNADVSIGACHLFDRLTVSCGTATFSAEPEHLARASALAQASKLPAGNPAVVIVVGDSVVVSDNGEAGGCSWMQPLVGELKPGNGVDNAATVNRVKSAITAAFKSQ